MFGARLWRCTISKKGVKRGSHAARSSARLCLDLPPCGVMCRVEANGQVCFVSNARRLPGSTEAVSLLQRSLTGPMIDSRPQDTPFECTESGLHAC